MFDHETGPRPLADYRHVFEFHVRFGDLDPQGHVNNCKVLDYLQDARLEMFHSDPVRKGGEPLRGLVIARHEVDYVRPMLFDVDPLRVETWVTELRVGSFRLAYEIRDDERVYVRAASVVVGYDVEAARARRFTAEERAFIERHLCPQS